MDSTRENNEPEKGNLAASVGVGAAGGVATAYLIHREGSVERRLEKAKDKVRNTSEARDIKAYEVERRLLKKDPEAYRLRTDYESAQSGYARVAGEHAEQVKVKWEELTNRLKLKDACNIEVKALESELAYVEKLPDSFGRGFKISVLNAQIKAVPTIMTPANASLTSRYTNTTIENKKSGAISGLKKSIEGNTVEMIENRQMVAAFDLEHDPALQTARLEAMRRADPEIGAQVEVATRQFLGKKEAMFARLEKAKNAWEPRRERLLGRQGEAYARAKAEEETLTALHNIHAEEGFVAALKKPFRLVREGGAGAGLAVLAVAVTLGSVVYSATRGSARAKPQDASFADRIDAQQAAAPAPVQGQG